MLANVFPKSSCKYTWFNKNNNHCTVQCFTHLDAFKFSHHDKKLNDYDGMFHKYTFISLCI